jgi:leucyl-tRNA synthetase
MMIWMNAFAKEDAAKPATLKDFLKLLAPYAPHIAEELWERLGEAPSIVDAGWPTFNEAEMIEDTVMLGILINGKPRSEVRIARDADEATALELAKADERASQFLDGKQVRKVVYVPGRIINIVAG